MKTRTAFRRVCDLISHTQNPQTDNSPLAIMFDEEYIYVNKLYYDRLTDFGKMKVECFISQRNDMKLVTEEEIFEVDSNYYELRNSQRPHPWI